MFKYHYYYIMIVIILNIIIKSQIKYLKVIINILQLLNH